MPARRTDIDIQQIIKLYEGGLSSTKIGKALGIGESTVLNRLREAGIPRRRSGPAPIYDDAKVCEMYRAGASVAEIKEVTGAKTVATFYAILKRNGVPVRLQRGQLDCPYLQDRVKALHAQGLTQVAIGKEIGVNRNYVGAFLRKEIAVSRKSWQPEVTVKNAMSIAEMRAEGLTIDEIAEITGVSRVEVFREIQGVL